MDSFNFECCICLEQFEKSTQDINSLCDNEFLFDITKILKTNCCNQIMHKSCLLEWLISKKNNENCPLCRDNIHIPDYYYLDELINNLHKRQKQDQYIISSILLKYYNIRDVYLQLNSFSDNNVISQNNQQQHIQIIHPISTNHHSVIITESYDLDESAVISNNTSNNCLFYMENIKFILVSLFILFLILIIIFMISFKNKQNEN